MAKQGNLKVPRTAKPGTVAGKSMQPKGHPPNSKITKRPKAKY